MNTQDSTVGDIAADNPSEVQPLIKQGWLRALLFYISFFIYTIVISVGGGLILTLGSSNGFALDFASIAMMLFELVSVLGSFLLIVVFRTLIDRRSVVSLGFAFNGKYRRDLGYGILLGVVLQLFMFGALWATGQTHVAGFRFVFGPLVVILFTLIFAAVQEEIVMRGYLLCNLMESANKYLSLILVSVVFAFMHGMNPDISIAGVLNIILAGLLLGMYYIHRKNLWFPIGLHIAWNYFEGPVLGSPVSGVKVDSIVLLDFIGKPMWTGGSFGFEASYALSIVLILAIIAVHLIYRTKPTADPASPVSSLPQNDPPR